MLSPRREQRAAEVARGAAGPRRVHPLHHRPAEGAPHHPQPHAALRVPPARRRRAGRPRALRDRRRRARARRRRRRPRRARRAAARPATRSRRSTRCRRWAAWWSRRSRSRPSSTRSCAHDAGAALVAVAEATAAGRDARTLGEALITRLRDAFLAVMKAPDRHLPGGRPRQGGGAGRAARRRRPHPRARGARRGAGRAGQEARPAHRPRGRARAAVPSRGRPVARRDHRAARTARARPGAAPRHRRPPSAGPAPASASAPRGGPADAAREELAKVGAPRRRDAPVKKATAHPRLHHPSGRRAGRGAERRRSPPTPGGRRSRRPTSSKRPGRRSSTGSRERPRACSATPASRSTARRGGAHRPERDRRSTSSRSDGRTSSRPWPRTSVVRCRRGSPSDAAAAPAPAAEPVPDDEPVDVHDLEDAPAGGTGVDRLAEAFPGAELVDE